MSAHLIRKHGAVDVLVDVIDGPSAQAGGPVVAHWVAWQATGHTYLSALVSKRQPLLNRLLEAQQQVVHAASHAPGMTHIRSRHTHLLAHASAGL
jgi:hypothetical protein